MAEWCMTEEERKVLGHKEITGQLQVFCFQPTSALLLHSKRRELFFQEWRYYCHTPADL